MNDPRYKPLIIRGAEQVRKITFVRHGPHLILVEVKSGHQGRLRSLHEFVDRAPHPYAVRYYAGKLSVERQKTPKGKPYILLNLPYFLGTRLHAYLDWLKDEHPA